MSHASNVTALLQQCKTLALEKRYAEALRIAQQLLQMDAENIAVHKLLALLYGLNNDFMKAHMHYMLLVQFDESYTREDCLLVAESYAEKKLYHAAALLASAAMDRFPDQRLYQLAIDSYEAAGEKGEAAKLRQQLATK